MRKIFPKTLPSLAVALLLAKSAVAGDMDLECFIVDPVETYQDAVATGVKFAVLLGEVHTSQALSSVNRAEHGRSVVSETFVVELTGHRLRPDGFTERFHGPIEMRQSCDPWTCGYFEDGEEVLVYAEVASDGSLAASIGPCGHWVQRGLTLVDASRLAACAQRSCPPAP